MGSSTSTGYLLLELVHSTRLDPTVEYECRAADVLREQHSTFERYDAQGRGKRDQRAFEAKVVDRFADPCASLLQRTHERQRRHLSEVTGSVVGEIYPDWVMMTVQPMTRQPCRPCCSVSMTTCSMDADGRLLGELRGFMSGIRSIALDASGQMCAAGSFDRSVRLWDIRQTRILTTWQGHKGGVWTVAASGDGRVIASGGDEGVIHIWERAQSSASAVLRGHTGAIWGIAFNPEAQRLVSGSLDGTVRIWSTRTLQTLAVLDAKTGPVWSVATSRDGRLVVGGGVAGVMTVWDASTSAPVTTFAAHSAAILALSSDGRLAASVSFDGTTGLWHTRTGTPVGRLTGHQGGVWGVAITPNGRLLATAGFDKTVRLWDAQTLQELAVLHHHTAGVWSLAFSADGAVLASAGVDGTIAIWDVPARALRTVLWRDRVYERMNITNLGGITEAQRAALMALGAVDYTAPTLQIAASRPTAVVLAEPPEPLSPRERQVLALVARGLPNKQIARELAVSEKTVKTHVSNILSKLAARSRTEAAMYAERTDVSVESPSC